MKKVLSFLLPFFVITAYFGGIHRAGGVLLWFFLIGFIFCIYYAIKLIVNHGKTKFQRYKRVLLINLLFLAICIGLIVLIGSNTEVSDAGILLISILLSAPVWAIAYTLSKMNEKDII